MTWTAIAILAMFPRTCITVSQIELIPFVLDQCPSCASDDMFRVVCFFLSPALSRGTQIMFTCWIYENLLHPKAVKCVCVIKFHQLISHLNHKNQTWPSDVVWWSSEHSSSKLPEWRCIFLATLKLGIQINSTVCHSLSQTDKSKSFLKNNNYVQ